jgi:hypothetical protein
MIDSGEPSWASFFYRREGRGASVIEGPQRTERQEPQAERNNQDDLTYGAGCRTHPSFACGLRFLRRSIVVIAHVQSAERSWQFPC